MNLNYDSPETALKRPMAGAEAGPMPSLTDAEQDWSRAVTEFAGVPRIGYLVHAALAVIAERDTEIAGLRAQLDSYQGRTVYFCLDRELGNVAVQATDADRGSVLRATDTGRELIYEGNNTWRERR